MRLRLLAGVDARGIAHVCLASSLVIGGSAAADARAGETRAGFAVKVHLSQSGHAADVPKAVASGAIAPGGSSSLHELKVNLPTRAGYFVRFEIVDPAVELVEIGGPGGVIPLTSGARKMFVPSDRQERITYRVKLRPGAHLAGAIAVRVLLQP
jgi:hypothetical protein